MREACRSLALYLVVLLVPSLLLGQTAATIIGQVTDQTKAVVPEVRVTAINSDTNLQYIGTSDGSGSYLIAALPPGSYRVQVEKVGFRTIIKADVTLHIQDIRELNFELAVGSVSESTTVQTEGAGVDTVRSDVSTVVPEVQVMQLPLNQRSFTALVTQQAGMVTVQDTAMNTSRNLTTLGVSSGSSQISANSERTSSLIYLIDGVPFNTFYGAPGTAAAGDIPGTEGIQEFRVMNHNFSAAYGGSAGSVVSFATRAGTNNLHGSVYEFLRNDILDARDYFNSSSEGKNPYRRNQFGGSIGGPIKRDKSFFFANYEALLSRLTTSAISYVPSMAARNGGVGGSSGFPVFDAWGNAVAISPGIKALLNQYPIPNGTDFGNGSAQSNYLNYHPVNEHYGLVRFDQVLGSKDNLMARYSVTNAEDSSPSGLSTWSLKTATQLQSLALKWTHILSNNFVSVAYVSGLRSAANYAVAPLVPVDPAAYTGDPAAKNVGLILLSDNSLSLLGNVYNPQLTVQNTYPVGADLTYTRGAHTLRFGGQYMPTQWNFSSGGMAAGINLFMNINDLLAADPAFMFNEKPGTSHQYNFRNTQYSWYVEDIWRARSNLNVTFGVRHEFYAPVLSEAHSPTLLGFADFQVPIVRVGEAALGNHTKKQFGPRIGLSYDPFKNGKTVIRAGFGIFFDTVMNQANINATGLLVYDPQPWEIGGFGPAALPPLYRPYYPVQLPFPTCPVVDGVVNCFTYGSTIGGVQGLYGPWRSPTSIQWNMQLERELPWNLKVQGTYVGSHTYNLLVQTVGSSNIACSMTDGEPYFGAIPGQCGTTHPEVTTFFGTTNVVQNMFSGHSNYNAGTVAVTRNFAGGMMFGSSYTFGKAISNGDVTFGGALLTTNSASPMDPLNPRRDRSESIFSVRHRVTMNGVFELPFGKGKKFAGNSSGVKQAFIGGWALSSILDIHSGTPMSVLSGISQSNSGNSPLPAGGPDRPNMLRYNAVSPGNANRYFDPKAYTLPDSGYFGDAPRNSILGPGFTEVDLSLSKHFKPTEKLGVDFRMEVFNILNHPNLGSPNNSLYTTTPALFPDGTPNPQADVSTCNLSPAQMYYASCNPVAGRITHAVGNPRQIQFGLKFTF